MQIGVRFPLFKEKFHLPSEFIGKTDHTDGISILREIRQEIIKAFGLWIPTHNHSQTKGLTLDEPFHCELGALLFGFGVVATFGSAYFVEFTGYYVVAYGAIGAGAIDFVYGLFRFFESP